MTTSSVGENTREGDHQSPRSRRATVALVTVLVMAVLSYQLNASMVTPALPDIAGQLQITTAAASQVTSVFFLAGTIGGIILVRWSDFIGRRRMLLLIIGAMLVGEILALISPNLEVLLAGRVLQGFSSAAYPLAYLLLAENLPAKTFGTVLGVITAINGGVGGADGYVGGLLSDTFGFRSLFLVIFIFGIVAAAGIALVLKPTPRTASAGRMDWAGAASITFALICLQNFVSSGSSNGWGTPTALAWLGGTLVSVALFWWAETRAQSPLIPLRELRSRQVWPLLTTTLLTIVGVYAAINFTVILLSQNDEVGFGMNASTSALFFLAPTAIIGIAAAPFAGWLAARRGWIKILRLALAASVVVLLVMVAFPTSQTVLVVMVALFGLLYNGVALTTLNGLAVLLSPDDAAGSLPGMNGACFGLGSGIGIALVAPFASLGTHQGFMTAFAISAGVTVLALVTSLILRPPAGRTL